MNSEDLDEQSSNIPETLWYVQNGDLLRAEIEAMSRLFPDFKLDKMNDNRLYWSGNLNPNGETGEKWSVMVVYENNHPGINSVKVYPINPDVGDIHITAKLPCILHDSNGLLYISALTKEDIESQGIASAATYVLRANEWIESIENKMTGVSSDDEHE